jgi:uncharacterized SAM-binding protein YcdF (DUF218 family)
VSRRRPDHGHSLGRVVAGSLLVIVVVLIGFVAVTFVQVWLASDQDDARPSDAVVVLGAAQWDGQPSPVFQQRLDHAADLHQRGLAPVIVVTGGKQAGDRVTQGAAAYDYLRGLGIADEALLVEVDGTDTYTELAASAGILDAAGFGQRVLLVTDGYHSMRTSMIATEVGMDAAVSPASGGGGAAELVRETAAVAAGRMVGFRRLSNWT